MIKPLLGILAAIISIVPAEASSLKMKCSSNLEEQTDKIIAQDNISLFTGTAKEGTVIVTVNKNFTGDFKLLFMPKNSKKLCFLAEGIKGKGWTINIDFINRLVSKLHEAK